MKIYHLAALAPSSKSITRKRILKNGKRVKKFLELFLASLTPLCPANEAMIASHLVASALKT
jgi:hypothetical protein